MVRLPDHEPEGRKASSIGVRTKARSFGRLCEFSRSAARMNAVAHRAEAREGLGPVVARRRADDAHRGLGAKPQPLHDGDRRIVLAAGGVDPRLVAGLAIDADRLRHRNPAVAYAGYGGRNLLGKAAEIGRAHV